MSLIRCGSVPLERKLPRARDEQSRLKRDTPPNRYLQGLPAEGAISEVLRQENA